MINCEFIYNKELINRMVKNSTRVINRILEICLVIMLASTIIIFFAGEIMMGVIFSVMFVAFVASLVITNITIRKSANVMLNQRVELQFNQDDMLMSSYAGDTKLSTAKIEYTVIKKTKTIEGLLYLYISNNSAIVIPTNAFDTAEQCQKAIDLASNNYAV